MAGVKIEGLKEFNSALRRVSKELPKVTRKVHADASKDLITRATANARSLPGGSKFAALFKVSAGQGWAGLRYKSQGAAVRRGATGSGPEGGWIYGSLQYRRFERPWYGPANNPFVEGFGDFGRKAYAAGPAIEASMRDYERDYDRLMRNAFKGAFPK